ncbi:MAG: multicopper oxidase family protein [Bryobacteraceae bacterium]|nr:multicopper oxidase family protein [Bryobacteraceae bacterium]
MILSVPRLRGSEGSGVVEATLTASQQWIPAGGRFAYLYAYNGQVPGPVIEARPGDEVRLTLRNELSEPTNLHFHGLHIPSTGNADNVMLRVPPGESQEYSFSIPANHPSGTFWYHPHVHGSAARQVSRGLAGAFLIRNPDDSVPEITRAPEALVVLQDFALDEGGRPVEPNMMDRMRGREGALVMATGALRPEFEVARDGWLRLRIVNASSSRFYRLRIEEHPMSVVASDGGYLPGPEVRDEVLLTPGERVEVMLSGSRMPGVYRILSLPYNRGGMGMMGGNNTGATFEVARLRYGSLADSAWDLPENLIRIDRLPEPSVRRVFQLGQGMGMGMMGGGMNFTINGRTFNEARIDVRAKLNDVEEWEFVNPSSMDHPMHVHTNPFQVVGGGSWTGWKDTVLVKAGGRVSVRSAFRDYEGVSPYHCHILDHEDQGMMGMLEIAAADPDSRAVDHLHNREGRGVRFHAE